MTEPIADTGFDELVAPLRPELHAHCYRMLGSVHDADDALQETLLKAWRAADRFEGRSSVRTWLFRVATNTCLDAVRARGRRALPTDLGPSSTTVAVDDAPRTDVAWLGPWPTPPDARAVQREAVELAFVAALQHLPPNQRAVLLLVEVLAFSAAEIAAIMATTTASVTSALQRARAQVGDALPRPAAAYDGHDLARRLADALENADPAALVDLLCADVTWTMPPLPSWYAGTDAVGDFVRQVPLGSCGEWRTRTTTANGQPAVALWLRPAGAASFDAWSITVLDTRDDGIAALTSFLDPDLFGRFGLSPTFHT